MVKGSRSVVYNNQNGAKNTSASGKPHPSPKTVVTGAGPNPSANWPTLYPAKSIKGR